MNKTNSLDLERYCTRIGYQGPRVPTLAVLHQLIEHHISTIPFENLDVLLGRPISLESNALQAKLLPGQRGGYCFEQNGLFLLVLEAFGFPVAPLSARVRWQKPRDLTPARTHLFARVEIEGQSWLADVGVGGISPTRALRLVEDTPQETPHDHRRIVREGGLYFHQVSFGEEWLDVCEFTLEEMPPIDRELANWFTSAHPQSHMKGRLLASRSQAEGRRLNLLNRTLTLRQPGREVITRDLASVEELQEVLQNQFGIHLSEPSDLATLWQVASLAS